MFVNAFQRFVTRIRGVARGVRRRPATVPTVAYYEHLEERTLLTVILDPEFGNHGQVVTDLTGIADISDDRANSVVIQSDGKIVVAGSSFGSANVFQGIVARYNTDGTLDPTFGAGGTVGISAFGPDGEEAGIQDVLLAPDGSIFAVGVVGEGAEGRAFGVIKLTTNGEIDLTFGISGLATVDFNGISDEVPKSMAFLGTSIVVVGRGISGAGDYDGIMTLLTAAGDLDTSFGTDGTNRILGEANDVYNAVAIDGSNNILIAGTTDFRGNQDFTLDRLDSSGQPTPDFGAGGLAFFDLSDDLSDEAFSLVVEPAGNILVAGSTTSPADGSRDFALICVDSTGALLDTFGVNGVVRTDFGTPVSATEDHIHQIVLQGNNVVAVGETRIFGDSQTSFAMARYSIATGAIDTTLDQAGSTGGRVKFQFNADTDDSANAVGIDAGGRLVLAGVTGRQNVFFNNFGVVRLKANGTVDTAFGSSGRVSTDMAFWTGISTDQASSVVELPDGSVLVAGSARDAPGGVTLGVIAKYLPNGKLDPAFGAGGQFSSVEFIAGITDMLVAPDGSVFVTGTVSDGVANQAFGVLKLDSSGHVDVTYGDAGLALADFTQISHTLEAPTALALQGTKLIVVGNGVNPSFGDLNNLAARFSAEGVLDVTFGINGVSGFGDVGDDVVSDVIIDSSNRIVLAGSSNIFGDQDFLLFRFSEDFKSVDATFGESGTRYIDFGSFLNDEAFSVVQDPNGNLFVAGSTEGGDGTIDFALAGLDENGDLLTDFGTNGLVTTAFAIQGGASDDQIRAIRLQGNSIVAAGSSRIDNPAGGSIPLGTISLARYSATTGLLDNTFDAGSGNGGRLQISVFTAPSAAANALTIGANNRIVVAGVAGDDNFGGNFAVTRINSNGTIDNTFGNRGTSAADFSSAVGPNDVANVIRDTTDGKLLVAGSMTSLFSVPVGFIARYNADGSLDRTFGAGGTLGLEVFFRGITGLVVGTDGNIFVTGLVSDGIDGDAWGVMKLTSTGQIDTGFGTRGLAVTDFAAVSYEQEVVNAIALQGASIVLVGDGLNVQGDRDFLITRLTANGSADSSIGQNGLLFFGSVRDDSATAVTIDNNDRILVAGTVSSESDLDFFVMRLEDSGGLDPTFNQEGFQLIGFSDGSTDAANSVVVDANDNIFVGGFTATANGGQDFALARMNDAGLLLPTFGTGGKVTTDFGSETESTDDQIQELRLQGSTVVAAGFSVLTGARGLISTFSLARYDSLTGALDLTTGGSSENPGKLQSRFFGFSESAANAMTSDSAGNWIVAGFAGDRRINDIALAKYVELVPPSVSLIASPTTIAEAAGTAIITATLSSVTVVDVTVNLQFFGTGDLGTDFTASSDSITIPAGQLTGFVTITGIADEEAEENQIIGVAIGSILNGIENGTQVVAITLQEPSLTPPALSGGSGTVTFKRGQSPVLVMSDLAVNGSVGAASLGRIEISFFVPKKGSLSDINLGNASGLGVVTSSGATDFKKAGGTRVVSIQLNQGVTDAQVQAFLRGISFSSAKFDPGKNSLGRKIEVRVFDRVTNLASNLVVTRILARKK